MTNEQIIAAVNRWQSDPRLHPLTCWVGSKHRNLVPAEIKGKVILRCPDCDYWQEHIPEVVLRPTGQTADLIGFFKGPRVGPKKPSNRA